MKINVIYQKTQIPQYFNSNLHQFICLYAIFFIVVYCSTTEIFKGKNHCPRVMITNVCESKSRKSTSCILLSLKINTSI